MALGTPSVSSPANGTAAIFTLLTTLCANGWLVKAWSDATTLTSGVSLSSNPYGSASSGAGNLGNTSAWFRIQDTGASREWLFQRGSGDATWTVSRAPAGTPFTGGTPSATTAGTSAAATALFSAATLFSATPGRMFISPDNATYGWRMWCQTLGGGNVLTVLADEPLASGTTDPSETDNATWEGYYNATGLAATGTWQPTTGSSMLVYLRFAAGSNQRGAYGVIYDNAVGSVVAPAQSSSAQVAQTPQSAKSVPPRIPVYRPGAASTTTGWRGYTSRARWCTTSGVSNGQTWSDGSGNYFCYMAGIWVPWDSSSPTLS